MAHGFYSQQEGAARHAAWRLNEVVRLVVMLCNRVDVIVFSSFIGFLLECERCLSFEQLRLDRCEFIEFVFADLRIFQIERG